MDNLESTIREHCTGLTSSRANERKKNAESLKDLLSRNALGAFLSKNTLKNEGFTWNNLFEYIKDYVLKEAENSPTSKTYQSVIEPLCTSLLHLCVAGANKGEANIKCEKVMSACLYVLKDNRLLKAIGDAYLKLLHKHILPNTYYKSFMTPVYWEELLNVCISILHSNKSKLDQFTKLRLLWMVMKNGTASCQLTIPIRDSLTKLRILRTFSDRKILEVVVDITIILLKNLAPEYRLSMCEFSENILLTILHYYEQNIDQKKKGSFFKLLELTVNLHHPEGRFQNQEGSLAHDWTIWNKHLHSMLEIVSMEVAFLQRPHKQLDLSAASCAQFYSFSASVYFQIFNLVEISESSEAGTAAKRPRVDHNKTKRLLDLILELEQSQVPWLGILLSYSQKYNNTIGTQNFLLLLHILIFYITKNINVNDWDSFTELILLTVKELAGRTDSLKKRDDEFSLLWNACIRHSTAVNSLQKPIHKLMQLLLTCTELKYQDIQPLLKLYFDKGMPVNSDTVETLNNVLQQFFNKCSTVEDRLHFFTWFKLGQVSRVDPVPARELMLRLVVKENINFAQMSTLPITNQDNLHTAIFDSIEKSILFSDFEIKDLEKQQPSSDTDLILLETNIDISDEICEYLRVKSIEYIKNMKANSIELEEFVKFYRIVLAYLDVALQFKIVCKEEMLTSQIYCLLRTSLRLMYTNLIQVLNSDVNNLIKIKILKSIQDILFCEYHSLLCLEVRRCIDEEFFRCANGILNKEDSPDEELNSDDEASVPALRCNVVLLLASFCRKVGEYRNDILDLVLDYKLYDYNSYWDVQCVFRCIELLSDPNVEEPPLDGIFSIMMFLCRYMFRGSNETMRLLKILLSLLDSIWMRDTLRQNCIIMIKGYLVRTGNSYYPPHVAALVYKCAAKVIVLNRKHGADENLDEEYFVKAVVDGTKKDTHCLRLYCVYTLKLLLVDYSDADIEQHLSGFTNIFIVNVTDNEELIVKDESANRTATLLHNYLALAQTKNTLIHKIVTSVLEIQKEKSLDENLIKKVLNIISRTITKDDISVHLNNNILYILNSWFLKQYKTDDLPISLFGMENKEFFLKKHMRWLITAELLWAKNANIYSSNLLKEMKSTFNKTDKAIFEECFCNFMLLCLPYIVAEKYNLQHAAMSKANYQQLKTSATKMFQLTSEVLENDQWSSLFVENVADLLFLAAKHLSDSADAGRMFEVELPERTETYYYPKNIFSAILDYFGELTGDNLMQYLCENQSVAIFKALFKLWDNILREHVFQYKVLSLHAFVTFVEHIPLGHISDAFICNFVCNSLTQAIKDSVDKREVQALAKVLTIILPKYLPEKVNQLRVAVSHLLSILIIKKEEGFQDECATLLNYLMVDLKEYLNDSEDVVDFIHSLSQGTVDNVTCSSFSQFHYKLKQHKASLKCPSHETLLNMRIFLLNNKQFVNNLCDGLDGKGFSENCESSLVHQIIYALSNILNTATDKKTIIEACNCLSVIGTYDLKTLATVSPADPSRILRMTPNSYFATIVMKSLTDVLFEEGPSLTKKVAKALNQILKFRDGANVLENEEVEEVKQIVKPFESAECDGGAMFKVNDSTLNCFTQSANFWLPTANEKHNIWLKRVTAAVLDMLASSTNYLNELGEVCISKPSVCQKILPSLIGVFIANNKVYEQEICHFITNFLKYIWDISFEYKIENSGDSSDNKRLSNILDHDHKMIIQYVLSVVNFVNLQSCHYDAKQARIATLTLNYLQLQYDKVAWAATVADQNLAAIYYGEIWAMSENDRVPPASPEATTMLEGGKNLQRIFRKCFVSIGEMDAVEGCGTAHLTIEEERRRHLIHTGQYTDALLLHDIALSCGDAGSIELQCGTLRSLQKSGLCHLAVQHIKSLPENDELNDIKYECMAALGDWSEVIDTRDLEKQVNTHPSNPHSIIKTFRYACLKDCLTLEAVPTNKKLLLSLNRAKLAISRLCQDLNMENCQNVYKVLAKLHLFSDIEDYFSVRVSELPISTLLTKWQVENLPAFHDFKHLEDLISQRNLMLEHAAKAQRNELEAIVSLQLRYAELGLENERVQLAQRFLAVVKKLRSTEEVALVESQISWARGHNDIALSLLRNIVANTSSNDTLTAKSLRQYGLWMAKSKFDNPKDIVEKYLKKSLDVLNNTDDEKTRLKLYNDIAKFSDAEYKKVCSYINSPIFQNKVQCLRKMQDTYASSQQTQESLTNDDRVALNTNYKFMRLEEAEINCTKVEKENFLHSAIRYYLLSLAQCNENNLSIFRVISLWLGNPGLDVVDGERRLHELFDCIPSHKFITVLPQLAPRLSADNTVFASNLRRIIKRCAKDHPHHTLPILFSLKNSDKDSIILNASGGPASAQISRPQEPRVATADAIVKELASDEKLAPIISQMDKLCDATISFANFTLKSKEPKQKIPAAENIHKLGHLDAIPVPTVTIPVKEDCNYNYLPTLVSFENYFEFVGGINCPKKINCKSSDGVQRILLVKGKDDLRQDAVMQQVFNLVNTLLEKNAVTSRSKLLIRTYKVVPLSKRSGVLEWCVGTIPIGGYLVGDSGAHARYRPQDMSCIAARKKLSGCHETGKSNEEKLRVFKKILESFKPVFHYFFTEHYLDPVSWYERRLTYTKSVAASSMVGYIMGLGDRHVQNILIDKQSAEVVHIDFGFAFDQGKILRTPETVPFRLTQDIIAGFGSCGVEGVFRKCCEKTMQLLRVNQETLLTILEVLLYDPLYSLTSSRQTTQSAFRNTAVAMGGADRHHLAERALLAVSSKLSGTEGGVAGGVAVPGQVARLIHCATDPANLCRLFPGWQPYL